MMFGAFRLVLLPITHVQGLFRDYSLSVDLNFIVAISFIIVLFNFTLKIYIFFADNSPLQPIVHLIPVPPVS